MMPQYGSLSGIVLLLAAPFIGSFLGVVIQRLPAGRSIVFGRSRCDSCGAVVDPLSLVPLIGWLIRRGQCRDCGASIGLFYPAIELGAVLVVAWSMTRMDGWLLWASGGLGAALLCLAVIDWRTFTLPDALTLPLIPAGLGVIWVIVPARLPDHVIGAIAGFFSFVIIGWVYSRLRGRIGLGLGDAKLLAAAGAWTGWQGLPSVVLLGCAGGLLLAVGKAVSGGKVRLDDATAFGPHLCLGLWLVWLYGPLVLP